jgi:hypothetical protein
MLKTYAAVSTSTRPAQDLENGEVGTRQRYYPRYSWKVARLSYLEAGTFMMKEGESFGPSHRSACFDAFLTDVCDHHLDRPF